MRTRSICLALAIVLICPVASAQWVQTNGPYGIPVNVFAVSGTNIFAGTDCGVFLSTDNGLSWSATGLNDKGFPLPVNKLVIKGTDIFAACGARSHERGSGWGDVFRSTDNGATWSRLMRIVADNYGSHTISEPVYTLTLHDSTLFAGGWGFNWSAGLYASTDNGTSWRLAGTGLNDELGNPFCIRFLYSSGSSLFASAFSGLYVSTNNGASWTLSDSSFSSLVIACMTVGGAYLYIGTSAGVFRSANNGSSWTAVNNGLINNNVSSLTASDAALYVGVSASGTNPSGIFRSTSNGDSWEPVSHDLDKATLMIGALLSHGGALLAGTFGSGVLRSTNAGTNWSASNSGLKKWRVTSLATHWDGKSVFVGTENGVYSSTDDGASWISAGLSSTSYANPARALAVNQSQSDSVCLIAGTASAGVAVTKDFGGTWFFGSFPIDDPMGIYYSITSLTLSRTASNDANLFAGCAATHNRGDMVSNSPGGAYRSTDGGTTWSNVSSELPRDSFGSYSSVWALAASDYGIFAGTDRGVFLSVNNGTSWNAVNAGLTDSLVDVLAVGGAGIFAGTGSRGVFLSLNNGESWAPVNTGLSDSLVTCFAVTGSSVFAGTPHHGVFRTTDNGTTWRAVSNGLDSSIAALAVSDSFLFAGTSSGVWKRPLSEMITSIEPPSPVPDAFVLCQNYPNPFNPSTTIRYELPRASQVNLTVYDMLGRTASVLVKEHKEAGVHEAGFDASGLSSGVYFYTLQAGGHVATKRLLVLR